MTRDLLRDGHPTRDKTEIQPRNPLLQILKKEFSECYKQPIKKQHAIYALSKEVSRNGGEEALREQ